MLDGESERMKETKKSQI